MNMIEFRGERGEASKAVLATLTCIVALAAVGIKGCRDVITGEGNMRCNTELTSPLSWIACPIINTGDKLTDIVSGEGSNKLEDIPAPKK